MAYEHFKPTIWSKKIQLDLDKLMVWKQVCNTNFQGEAEHGKTVKIIGIVNPTINKYVVGTPLASPETPVDKSGYLYIDQQDYFNVLVDDVDKAQSHVNEMTYLLKGGASAMARESDAYVGSLLIGAKHVQTGDMSTPAKAKKTIDDAFVQLWANGVKTGRDTFIVVSPQFYSVFKNSMEENLTNNVEMLEKGIFGYYNGAKVLMSNNLHNDGTNTWIAVCQKDAITFADGIEKTEAYRPENSFSDAVKALHTYGAKIVRPEQVVAIKI